MGGTEATTPIPVIAPIQPIAPVLYCAIGTTANCPNQPPALTKPLAMPRFSGGSARDCCTPNSSANTSAAEPITQICGRLNGISGHRKAGQNTLVFHACDYNTFCRRSNLANMSTIESTSLSNSGTSGNSGNTGNTGTSAAPRIIRAQLATITHGTVNPRDVAHLSGLEFFEGMANGTYPAPPIAKTLNFGLLEVEHGRAVFEGTPLREFYNPIGSIHGGFAGTLLDSCMGCAVHTTMAAGQAYTTLEYKVSLIRGMSDQTGDQGPRSTHIAILVHG